MVNENYVYISIMLAACFGSYEKPTSGN